MVRVGQDVLTLNDFSAIVFKKAPVDIPAAALEKVNTNVSLLF